MPAMPARGRAGETHYSVLLVSEAFRGLGRVARPRAVHEALAPSSPAACTRWR